MKYNLHLALRNTGRPQHGGMDASSKRYHVVSIARYWIRSIMHRHCDGSIKPARNWSWSRYTLSRPYRLQWSAVWHWRDEKRLAKSSSGMTFLWSFGFHTKKPLNRHLLYDFFCLHLWPQNCLDNNCTIHDHRFIVLCFYVVLFFGL